jgi:hypothetical protein
MRQIAARVLLPNSDPRGNNFAKGGRKSFLKDTAAKRVEAAEMEAELSADVKNLQGRRMKGNAQVLHMHITLPFPDATIDVFNKNEENGVLNIDFFFLSG